MPKYIPAPIGERYGRLTVLGEGPAHESARTPTATNKNYHLAKERQWIVQCDCGVVTWKLRKNIVTGRTTSCGGHGRGPVKKNPNAPITYHTMHRRLWDKQGKAVLYPCKDCGKQAAEWSYNHGCEDEYETYTVTRKRTQKLTPYCEHMEHYAPRCISCHRSLDKRVSDAKNG